MPLRITQQECDTGRLNDPSRRTTDQCHAKGTVLKVQGSLYLEDAELLEKICQDVRSHTGTYLTLDLADLSFLDSESASVLCRLRREQHVNLEGLHLFIAKVIELTEAEAAVCDYLPRSE